MSIFKHIEESKRIIVSGAPASGKTWFTTVLASIYSQDYDVYLNTELNPREYVRRFDMLGLKKGDHSIGLFQNRSFKFNSVTQGENNVLINDPILGLDTPEWDDSRFKKIIEITSMMKNSWAFQKRSDIHDKVIEQYNLKNSIIITSEANRSGTIGFSAGNLSPHPASVLIAPPIMISYQDESIRLDDFINQYKIYNRNKKIDAIIC